LTVKPPVRAVVIVVVLPTPAASLEKVNIVGDTVFVEQLIELLVVDPVRPFHLAIEVRRPRPDVDMPNVEAIPSREPVDRKSGSTAWSLSSRR